MNAKTAIFAAEQAMKVTGVEVPVMLSVTVSDVGGRTLSGQTLDAFLASVQHANIFSVGLNCSFGARQLKPFLEQLAVRAPYYISAYPNAGLPNSLGKYDQTPADMAHEGVVTAGDVLHGGSFPGVFMHRRDDLTPYSKGFLR